LAVGETGDSGIAAKLRVADGVREGGRCSSVELAIEANRSDSIDAVEAIDAIEGPISSIRL
jgi:hypothetical protein